jgi:hypothetical protein
MLASFPSLGYADRGRLGRLPMIAKPAAELLPACEAMRMVL